MGQRGRDYDGGVDAGAPGSNCNATAARYTAAAHLKAEQK